MMSKELEALKEARNHRHEKDKNLVVIDIDYFNQCLDGIETALKALEIIKNTRVDTNIIKESKDYNDYCGLEAQKMLTLMFSAPKQIGITEEEYDLLKEVLL